MFALIKEFDYTVIIKNMHSPGYTVLIFVIYEAWQSRGF